MGVRYDRYARVNEPVQCNEGGLDRSPHGAGDDQLDFAVCREVGFEVRSEVQTLLAA